jgi:hypothetical protein
MHTTVNESSPLPDRLKFAGQILRFAGMGVPPSERNVRLVHDSLLEARSENPDVYQASGLPELVLKGLGDGVLPKQSLCSDAAVQVTAIERVVRERQTRAAVDRGGYQSPRG